MRRPRCVTIDHFHCGCTEDALRRSDLTGYCKYHGESRMERLVLPLRMMSRHDALAELTRLSDGAVHSRDEA